MMLYASFDGCLSLNLGFILIADNVRKMVCNQVFGSLAGTDAPELLQKPQTW